MAAKVFLTPNPLRSLSLEDLGLTLPDIQATSDPKSAQDPAPASDPAPVTDDISLDFADEAPVMRESELDANDELLALVRELMADGYAGVILTGPPGTGKSWYGEQLALALTQGDTSRVRFLQFHPSYQYEDFVEGYVPDDGGFKRTHKHLLLSCETAQNAGGKLCVMVIDELSRSDPARVFGEALTYVETSKRGKRFRLASGQESAIPPNLFFICTMNLHDRGVDEVDTAFERRFAKIEMNPNAAKLTYLLSSNGVPDDLQGRVKQFFGAVQKEGKTNPEAHIGHAYFRTVRDEASLRRLWNNQLRFVMQKAYRLDPDGFKRIESAWRRVVPEPVIEVNVTESFQSGPQNSPQTNPQNGPQSASSAPSSSPPSSPNSPFPGAPTAASDASEATTDPNS